MSASMSSIPRASLRVGPHLSGLGTGKEDQAIILFAVPVSPSVSVTGSPASWERGQIKGLKSLSPDKVMCVTANCETIVSGA